MLVRSFFLPEKEMAVILDAERLEKDRLSCFQEDMSMRLCFQG